MLKVFITKVDFILILFNFGKFKVPFLLLKIYSAIAHNFLVKVLNEIIFLIIKRKDELDFQKFQRNILHSKV